jgi:hypothetical protein
MKKARFTLLFYAIALEILFALKSWFPTGNNTPVLIAFLLFALVVLYLFIRSCYLAIKGNKAMLPATVVHSIFITGMIVLLSI